MIMRPVSYAADSSTADFYTELAADLFAAHVWMKKRSD